MPPSAYMCSNDTLQICAAILSTSHLQDAIVVHFQCIQHLQIKTVWYMMLLSNFRQDKDAVGAFMKIRNLDTSLSKWLRLQLSFQQP